MSKFRQVDFWFTEDGDLAIDATGDLKDTEGTMGRAILQEVRDRLMSRPGEWALNASIGSILGDFLGEPGSEIALHLAAEEIGRAITTDRLLVPGEVQVLPMLFSEQVFVFRIIIYTADGELSAQFGFDSDRQRFIGF